MLGALWSPGPTVLGVRVVLSLWGRAISRLPIAVPAALLDRSLTATLSCEIWTSTLGRRAPPLLPPLASWGQNGLESRLALPR